MTRLPVICVVLAAVVAGLFFAPVFGVPALLLPLAVVAALVLGVTEWCARKESLVPWRPLLMMAAGLLGITETLLFPTTLAGLPTGQTFAALASGITDSWQLTLQSTWPARPDAALVLFVPLLVLLACVFGVEVMLRLRKPLPALVPSLVVVVVSQLYAALSGVAAVVGAVGYAVVAGLLFLRPDRSVLGPALPLVALGGVVAVAAGLFVPAPAPAYSLKRDQVAQVSARVANPLEDIAYRLSHPDVPVFSVRGSAADRWPIVVLDSFDGVNWAPGGRYRRLGTELPPNAAVTVPVRRQDATVGMREVDGLWLPSQTWPAAVTGAEPLVEETQGTLVTQQPVQDYTLSWWEPDVGLTNLDGAAVDPYAQGGRGGVGTPPEGVEELARQAVRGLRPSFGAALQLERFFKENYKVSTGTDLPSGHGWPQLRRFLMDTKQGTSEQFASAYVVLARMIGIPARLVVGYRAPESDGEYTVHNRDALAWPEVAVAGVGWVPLDPDGTAAQGGSGTGLAAAKEQARTQLPPPDELRDPPVAASPDGTAGQDDGAGRPFPWEALFGSVAALVLAWLLGVPLAKGIRASRRRRRPGTGAVLGAWLEVRDRLREHHVPFTAGMTARDLAAAASRAGLRSTVDGLLMLGSTLDLALWSGVEPSDQVRDDAWAAVYTVRRRLAKRGLVARLRAAVNPRTLFRLRA